MAIIISFEAIDKAGKHTQALMLYERLVKEGYRVFKDEYPDYSTETGELIRQYLAGEIDMSKTMFECVQNANKHEKQLFYDELEHEGYDVIIMDRYLLSQLVYAQANGVDINWCLNLIYGMKKSSLDIVIDITPEESMKRKGKHNNGVNDRYESDIELLTKVRHNYLTIPPEYTSKKGKKVIIDGMRTKEEIHEDVYQVVKRLL